MSHRVQMQPSQPRKCRRRTFLTDAARLTLAGALACGTFVGRQGPVLARPAPKSKNDESKNFVLKDIKLPGAAGVGKRMVLLSPTHTTKKLPLLVLLHGLGETGDERMGAYAWVERYGLAAAYDRLLSPPLKALDQRMRHWKRARLEAVNKLLVDQPFEGVAIACAYTPNVYKAANRKKMLDRYAAWIRDEVVVRARRELNVYQDARHTYLDGCSLGGYVGLEVFLRLPQQFGAWGAVQGALGAHRVVRYAERLAAISQQHGPRSLRLHTSSQDPFRSHHQRLSKELAKRAVAHELSIAPGPHNQPFLRDSASAEMLLWHSRLSHSAPTTSP